MKKINVFLKCFVFVGLLVMMGASAQAAMTLTGTGSTFAYPFYSVWFYDYAQQTGVQVNYQALGSGAGIEQFSHKLVDFGASDAYLSKAQMRKIQAKDHFQVLHFPTAMGCVVLSYNVPGIPNKIKITPAILAAMYMGKIKNWDNPALRRLNPGVHFPNLAITCAHRADGSGTTNIFTNYLSKVSPAWRRKIGFGTAVDWPVGVGGKGNPGVAGLIQQIPGCIGYIEYAYSVENKLPYALLRNRSGFYPLPSIRSTIAAAAGALRHMPKDFRVMITNSWGKPAYPIAGMTWMLIASRYNPKVGAAIVRLLHWEYTVGEKKLAALNYTPLPPSLIRKVMAQIKEIHY